MPSSCRRSNWPFSRSLAIDVPSAWKLVSMMPVAAIPARKYWANGMSPGRSSPPRTDAKITSITTG